MAESDKKNRHRHHKPQPNHHNRQLTTVQQVPCNWCGKRHSNGRDQCPARAAICHKCKKRGLFQAVCKSKPKTLGNIEETVFIGAISGIVAAVNTPNDLWTVSISLGGTLIDFKLDTGADVTAIPLTTFNSLANVKLMETNRILEGPGQEDLQVRGKFMTDLRW